MRITTELKSPLNRLFIYETADGYRVESVFYKGERLCVSSQVGCPVGCAFCASGLKGLKRNLSAEEIYAQYSLLKGELPIRGIAIAGIGEPALNADSVVEAIGRFKKEGLKVTVSSTGCDLEGFRKLVEAPHNGLTISVHAVKPHIRERLFKLKQPIEKVLEVVEEHLERSSSSRRKRFQLGYLLIKGVNDDEESLKLLAELAKRHRFTVMLMAYNEVEGLPFKGLSEEEYEKAFLKLRELGVRVTLSNRFRRDKLGGCGTLTIAREVKDEA
ncbi:Radical SAM domain protein [Thermovibrio ammonificans HB-1]|uniref:Radical SAM domain protein n=1 Tax=Thermovibrio ammonificans (strain DSM 15698 / JCM 12110 / HB-1) TaxID=648996 RepID=E8T550_THEA1|nr:radical SAM protein [Thermovibrio ammonificans]ADU96388.1 Radical SAM domain protein [Thermovibrio ammonificans HB-1]